MKKTAKELAEEAMPGWQAVDVPLRDAQRSVNEADQVGDNIDSLKQAYGKQVGVKPSRGKRSALSADITRDASHTTMVVMQPKNLTDAGQTKIVLVQEKDKDENGEVTGYQG